MRPPHTAKRGTSDAVIPLEAARVNQPDTTESVGSIGERALIARIRQRAGIPPAYVAVGIGHDCAALQPDRGALTVITTDSLIEDVHFRRDWTAARDIGHKALAVNLSDLAAMAASPRAATLSLGLPAALPLGDFDDLIDGFLTLATDHRVALVGGNISTSPGPLIIDVTLIGSAHPRKLLTRAGARPGDELYLTGAIGGASAGLSWAATGLERTHAPEIALHALERYERPTPRSRIGSIVGRSRGATAAIDLSDGLAEAARQLAEESGVGIELDAEAIPIDPAMLELAEKSAGDPLLAALSGGEDYELLFAVPPRRRGRFLTAVRRCRDVVITRIGIVTAGADVTMRRQGEISALPQGFRHFSSDSARTDRHGPGVDVNPGT